MEPRRTYVRGFTLRSCLVSLFGIVIVAALVQFFEGVEGNDPAFGAHTVPIPALFIVIPLTLVSGLCYTLTRIRLLTRAELLTILFALFLATPLTSNAFWTMMIGAIGTIPKTADFDTYDAWPSKLWPHGPNLAEDALRETNRGNLPVQGNVTWREIEYDKAKWAVIPVLDNADPKARSSLRVPIPIAGESGTSQSGIVIGEPYFLTVLLRPENLGPESEFYCRVYYDDDAYFATEAFTSRSAGDKNLLHPTGFSRRGMYGLTVSETAKNKVFLEFGLFGRGRLALADVELMDVGTLDSIYHGRKLTTRASTEHLRKPLPTELLVQPDRWLSIEGLKFLAAGYTPWKEWCVPLFAWASFALLLLLGAFCVMVIMHRQWIDRERYPLPLTRIPLALLGEEDTPGSALSSIWSNRMMWIGFGFTLFWCFMKAWHLYNLNVPNMNIEVKLTPYFTSPMWGKMWQGLDVRNMTFTVTALFLSLAIFMELNVLMSLFLGFFLYRCQYWFGEATGLALKKDFPFFEHQQVGAYVAYALLIVFFSRKHLWRVLRSSVTGPSDNPETRAYRFALPAFGLCIVATVLWSDWVGIPTRGVLAFFVFLMMISLVAAKLRCECGTPFCGFTPINVLQFVPLAGGIFFFGPSGVLLVIFVNWIMFRYSFFLMPGMQLELVEVGRRANILPRHIVYTVLLGALGGLFIGGWVFLSMGYALGGDNFSQRYPYMDKGHLINDYNMEVARANVVINAEKADSDAADAKPPDNGAAASATGSSKMASFKAHLASLGAPGYGYLFAATVTTILTILRQVFSGFWFHPIGFVVGSTVMMEYIWGSVIVAFIIRAVTLRIGGAVVVREKLMPFFVGVFLASLVAYFALGMFNGYLYFVHPSFVRKVLVF